MHIREVNFEDYSKIKDLTDRNNIAIYDKFYWEKVWKENPFLKLPNLSSQREIFHNKPGKSFFNSSALYKYIKAFFGSPILK